MSYGPPPTKSPYGDTDFVADDNWNQTSFAPKAQQPVYQQAQSTTYNPLPNPRFSTPPVHGLQPGMQSTMDGQVPDFASVANSMTQEDILFMRKFRRDLFFYRVIPISAVGFGSLYWFNKTRNIPNTVGRFLGVGFASFFLSISTFRSDFKRMVEESRLNTPYMQAIRKTLNIRPLEDAPAGDYGMEYGNKYADGSSNWNATELSGNLRYPGGVDSPGATYQSNPPFVHENQDTEVPKQATSYEELRARNRGYIR